MIININFFCAFKQKYLINWNKIMQNIEILIENNAYAQ
jgi:hypothetical protein